jgi:hypothetical protein
VTPAARTDARVVWVKGSNAADPNTTYSVFGRSGKKVDLLREAGTVAAKADGIPVPVA